MTSPHTASPDEAFLIAETALACLFGVVVWSRAERPAWSRALLILGMALAATANGAAAFIQLPGVSPDAVFRNLLTLSGALATVAMAAPTHRRTTLPWAVLFQVSLALMDRSLSAFADQRLERAALYVIAIGVLAGIDFFAGERPRTTSTQASPASYAKLDLMLFATAVVAAATVSSVVLKHEVITGDEWAYTFQAATFAKLRAYAPPFPCNEAFRSFWVFNYEGRMFSQYLPGWPLFMAPFLAAHVVWLAAPVSLGLLVTGAVRLSRRAVAARIEGDHPARAARLITASWLAASSILLSNTLLLNGGSRFPHVFVAALYAWAIESLCIVNSDEPTGRRLRWGILLGVVVAWLLGTRHSDALLLGTGMAVYGARALIKRRPSLPVLLAIAAPFATLGLMFLVILRLQTGGWGRTGYSITPLIYSYPWAVPSWSIPTLDEVKWSLPIGTGAYSWFPLSPALGLAGLISLLRSSERRLTLMLSVGGFSLLSFYTLLTFARGGDSGYGPRYQLVLVVPMVIGTVVMIEPLLAKALWPPKAAGSVRPRALASAAVIATLAAVVGLAPLIYPYNAADVLAKNDLQFRIADAHLSSALVSVGGGVGLPTAWRDLLHNFPYGLYANDVLVALDDTPELAACIAKKFPGRHKYTASGRDRVVITPTPR